MVRDSKAHVFGATNGIQIWLRPVLLTDVTEGRAFGKIRAMRLVAVLVVIGGLASAVAGGWFWAPHLALRASWNPSSIIGFFGFFWEHCRFLEEYCFIRKDRSRRELGHMVEPHKLRRSIRCDGSHSSRVALATFRLMARDGFGSRSRPLRRR
jgi:hypothetical protein